MTSRALVSNVRLGFAANSSSMSAADSFSVELSQLLLGVAWISVRPTIPTAVYYDRYVATPVRSCVDFS